MEHVELKVLTAKQAQRVQAEAAETISAKQGSAKTAVLVNRIVEPAADTPAQTEYAKAGPAKIIAIVRPIAGVADIPVQTAYAKAGPAKIIAIVRPTAEEEVRPVATQLPTAAMEGVMRQEASATQIANARSNATRKTSHVRCCVISVATQKKTAKAGNWNVQKNFQMIIIANGADPNGYTSLMTTQTARW